MDDGRMVGFRVPRNVAQPAISIDVGSLMGKMFKVAEPVSTSKVGSRTTLRTMGFTTGIGLLPFFFRLLLDKDVWPTPLWVEDILSWGKL